MTTTRPPCQWELAFPTPDPGEAAGRHGQEAEMVTAAPGPESPAVSEPRSPLNPPNRRGTDPYARWCGRGGTARCPPIPIGLFRHEHGATISRRSGCFRGTFLMRQRPRLGNISGEAMRTRFLIVAEHFRRRERMETKAIWTKAMRWSLVRSKTVFNRR